MGRLEGTSRRRGNYIFVAASDAPASEKRGADFVCDGVADDVTIEAALAAIHSGGGRVELSTGNFSLSSTINITSHDTTLQGAGRGATVISLASPFAAIDVGSSAQSLQFVNIRGMHLNYTGTARETGSVGVHYHRGQSTVLEEMLIASFEEGVQLDANTGTFAGFVQPVVNNVRLSQCLVGVHFVSDGSGGNTAINVAQLSGIHIVGPGSGVAGSFGIEQDDNCGQGNWCTSASVESVETSLQMGGRSQWWSIRSEDVVTRLATTATTTLNHIVDMGFSSGGFAVSPQMDFGTVFAQFGALNARTQLLAGESDSTISIGGTKFVMEALGSSAYNSGIGLGRWGANGNPPSVNFFKSRGTTTSSRAIVQTGDDLGVISFYADDGEDNVSKAADIYVEVDAAPSSGSVPAQMIFRTTDSGATAPDEKLRLDVNGVRMVTLPTSDPGILGQLWVDTAAAFTVKSSSG